MRKGGGVQETSVGVLAATHILIIATGHGGFTSSTRFAQSPWATAHTLCRKSLELRSLVGDQVVFEDHELDTKPSHEPPVAVMMGSNPKINR